VTDKREQRLSAAGRELLRKRLSGQAPTTSELLGRTLPQNLPLSFGQRRLWFINQLAERTVAYNIPIAYRLRGPLDTAALERAIGQVIHRHESLRTRFAADQGEPYQIVDEPTEFRLEVSDIGDTAEAVELVRTEAEVEFNLERGPLFRARLIRLGPDEHVLAIVVHHTVFDRASLEIWTEEVSRGYANEALRPAVLPVQYADFADWQRATLTEEVLGTHLAYWQDRLAGAPFVLELPNDHPRPSAPSWRAGFVDFTVPADIVTALRQWAESLGATLFTVGLMAYQAVLARHTGAEEVLVGCPASGRTQVALERLIGFFVNSLPIRADLRGDPLVADLLTRAKTAVLEAHAHQDAPFDQIVERVDPPRDLSRNPIFQVWYDLAAVGGGELALPGIDVLPWEIGRLRTRFDVELHLVEDPSGMVHGRLLYAEDLFERHTAIVFAEHYQNFLVAVAENPAQRFSEVQIFSAGELEQILEHWATASGWRH
jgi:hypothetical protein